MRYRTGTGTVVAVALASGCALVPFGRYRPGRLTDGSIDLKVPIVRQEEEEACGQCVVAMLARYYEEPVDEEDLKNVRRQARAEALTGRQMKEVLERNAFDVRMFAGKLLDEATPSGITYHLEKGRPVVVMVSLRKSRYHYTIVKGWDPTKDLVLFADPSRGEVACRSRAFRRMWEKRNFFTLVAIPVKLRYNRRRQQPPSAVARDGPFCCNRRRQQPPSAVATDRPF